MREQADQEKYTLEKFESEIEALYNVYSASHNMLKLARSFRDSQFINTMNGMYSATFFINMYTSLISSMISNLSILLDQKRDVISIKNLLNKIKKGFPGINTEIDADRYSLGNEIVKNSSKSHTLNTFISEIEKEYEEIIKLWKDSGMYRFRNELVAHFSNKSSADNQHLNLEQEGGEKVPIAIRKILLKIFEFSPRKDAYVSQELKVKDKHNILGTNSFFINQLGLGDLTIFLNKRDGYSSENTDDRKYQHADGYHYHYPYKEEDHPCQRAIKLISELVSENANLREKLAMQGGGSG